METNPAKSHAYRIALGAVIAKLFMQSQAALTNTADAMSSSSDARFWPAYNPRIHTRLANPPTKRSGPKRKHHRQLRHH